MLVVRKFNPIYSNQAPAFPSSSSSSDLPRTWSSLIKSANTLHRNLGGSALIFSLIPYSLILTYTCFHRCLYLSPILCLSLALFLSFSPVCLRCCISLLLKHTLHFSLCLFFSGSHFMSPLLSSCTLFPLMPSLSRPSSLPRHLCLLSSSVALPLYPSPSPLAPCMFHFPTSPSPLSCCCLSWWHVEERCYTELDEI